MKASSQHFSWCPKRKVNSVLCFTKLAFAEAVLRSTTFPNGGDAHHTRPPAERGLVASFRPKECLFVHPHIPTSPGSSWKGHSYEFTSLPFGLSTAPWVFTKALRSVIGLLQKRGIRCVIYLDDILIMHQRRSLFSSRHRLL